MNARKSFVIVVVIAAGGAFLFSGFGPQWLPVTWAAAAMLGYLVWVRATLPDYGESQGFADDFYFLGFLLTLVALATVLMRVGDLGDADVLPAVLSQFGLALGTTILGLAVRTALLLGKEDMDETEERARKRVERAFDTLSSSLNRLSAEADVFAMQYAEKLETSLAPVEKAVTGVTTAIEVIEDELRRAQAGISELSGSVRTASEQLEAAGDGIQSKLGLSGSRVEAALNRLAEGVEHSGQDVRTRLTDVTDVIEQANQRAEAGIEESLARMERVVAATNTSSKSLAQVTEKAAGTVSEEVGKIVQDIRDLAASTGDAVTHFSTGADELKEIIAAWRRQLEELAVVQGELTGQAAGSGHAVAAVRSEIADGVNELVRVLRGLDGR